MNKRNLILLLSSLAVLASCGGGGTSSQSASSASSSASQSESSSAWTASSTSSSIDTTVSYTITFESNGGSEVAPIKVYKNEIPTPPEDPVKDGQYFWGWYSDQWLVVQYYFDTPLTENLTLYAKWGDEPWSTSSYSTQESSSSSTSEGMANWWLCGSGSLWGSDGWTTAGGYQLEVNPDNPEDKGRALGVPFVAGDIFKVTDGTTWYGYDMVNKWDDPANKGLYAFEAADDGYGGTNIKCSTSGTYDIYVNGSGELWIQDAA